MKILQLFYLNSCILFKDLLKTVLSRIIEQRSSFCYNKLNY